MQPKLMRKSAIRFFLIMLLFKYVKSLDGLSWITQYKELLKLRCILQTSTVIHQARRHKTWAHTQECLKGLVGLAQSSLPCLHSLPGLGPGTVNLWQQQVSSLQHTHAGNGNVNPGTFLLTFNTWLSHLFEDTVDNVAPIWSILTRWPLWFCHNLPI